MQVTHQLAARLAVESVPARQKTRDESEILFHSDAKAFSRFLKTFRIFNLESCPAAIESQTMPDDTPEADPRFNEFIILQAQNAGLFLGQIPNPHSGEKQINIRAARSVMDSLEMLASKTRGNLTPSEAKLLHTALDNLRPLYNAARNND